MLSSIAPYALTDNIDQSIYILLIRQCIIVPVNNTILLSPIQHVYITSLLSHSPVIIALCDSLSLCSSSYACCSTALYEYKCLLYGVHSRNRVCFNYKTLRNILFEIAFLFHTVRFYLSFFWRLIQVTEHSPSALLTSLIFFLQPSSRASSHNWLICIR